MFGTTGRESLESHLSSVQVIGGTGANHLAALFLAQHLHPQSVWIPMPTWNNHDLIWEIAAPHVERRSYPYYNTATKTFDIIAMIATLRQSAQHNDVLLLHACAHNPTGLDPSKAQWNAIKELCVELRLFVVFNLAYQGFASGDLDTDAWAVRHCASDLRLEMTICQSFSKNFDLYGERVGALHLLTTNAGSVPAVRSQLIRLQRAEISTPARFGARIVALTDTALLAEWLSNIKTMSSRVAEMRLTLYHELVRLGTPGDWSHIVKQIGMFSFTGLSPTQVKALKQRHHVYLMENGRVSVCGLTKSNVRYVAMAIHDVVVTT